MGIAKSKPFVGINSYREHDDDDECLYSRVHLGQVGY